VGIFSCDVVKGSAAAECFTTFHVNLVIVLIFDLMIWSIYTAFSEIGRSKDQNVGIFSYDAVKGSALGHSISIK
jgi:hypothetical protein